MKLYTEEQLIQILFYLDITNLTFEDIKSKLELIKEVMPFTTPIELPSDEEIEKYIEKTFYGEKKYYFKAGIDFIKQTLIRQKND